MLIRIMIKLFNYLFALFVILRVACDAFENAAGNWRLVDSALKHDSPLLAAVHLMQILIRNGADVDHVSWLVGKIGSNEQFDDDDVTYN